MAATAMMLAVGMKTNRPLCAMAVVRCSITHHGCKRGFSVFLGHFRSFCMVLARSFRAVVYDALASCEGVFFLFLNSDSSRLILLYVASTF